jgi:hypothetical protein
MVAGAPENYCGSFGAAVPEGINTAKRNEL